MQAALDSELPSNARFKLPSVFDGQNSAIGRNGPYPKLTLTLEERVPNDACKAVTTEPTLVRGMTLNPIIFSADSVKDE